MMRFQQKDKSLIETIKETPKDYSIKQFHVAGKKYSQHTPSQLVFGRDAILNINQEANWHLIKQC